MEKAESNNSKVIVKKSVPSGKYNPSFMNNTKINSLQDNNNKIICDTIMKNLGKTKINPSNKYSTKVYGGKTPMKINSLNSNIPNKTLINEKDFEQTVKDKNKVNSNDNANQTPNNFKIAINEFITPINNISKSPLNKISHKKDSNIKLSIADFEEKKVPSDIVNNISDNKGIENNLASNININTKVNKDLNKNTSYTLSDKKYLSPICFKDSSTKLKEVKYNKQEEVINSKSIIDSNINIEEDDEEEKIKNLIIKKEKILEHKKKVSFLN